MGLLVWRYMYTHMYLHTRTHGCLFVHLDLPACFMLDACLFVIDCLFVLVRRGVCWVFGLRVPTASSDVRTAGMTAGYLRRAAATGVSDVVREPANGSATPRSETVTSRTRDQNRRKTC